MLPKIKDLIQLIRNVKGGIDADYRAFEDDDTPGIQLTVACDNDGEWDFQTGDNSYSGAAYHYPHWAVVGVYPDSSPFELARDIRSQLRELLPS